MGELPHLEILKRGLGYTLQDYKQISALESDDVKPKEDQIKCGLYRAFSEEEHLVLVESAYSRNGMRCDLRINKRDRGEIAIEIKTAWAGDGWVNKPDEQARTWAKDVEKLSSLITEQSLVAAYFILVFAYQAGSTGERLLRERIDRISLRQPCVIETEEIGDWNRLNRLQCFVFDIIDRRAQQID